MCVYVCVHTLACTFFFSGENIDRFHHLDHPTYCPHYNTFESERECSQFLCSATGLKWDFEQNGKNKVATLSLTQEGNTLLHQRIGLFIISTHEPCMKPDVRQLIFIQSEVLSKCLGTYQATLGSHPNAFKPTDSLLLKLSHLRLMLFVDLCFVVPTKLEFRV